MGVSEAVGAGRTEPRFGKVKRCGGVGCRGGAMRGGSGARRDACPGTKTGCTKYGFQPNITPSISFCGT